MQNKSRAKQEPFKILECPLQPYAAKNCRDKAMLQNISFHEKQNLLNQQRNECKFLGQTGYPP